VDEFRHLTIEALLRQVAAARAEDRLDTVQREWHAVVVRATPRIRAVVKSFSFPGQANVRIHPDEVDDVVHEALIRAMRRMDKTLQTTNEKAFLAAMGTCAFNECRDRCRSRLVHEKRSAGNLGDPARGAKGDDERTKHDDALYRLAEQQRLDDDAAHEARDRVQRALARIENPVRRKVLELLEAGYKVPEVAEALNLSPANVYQHRSRGLTELRGLMDP